MIKTAKVLAMILAAASLAGGAAQAATVEVVDTITGTAGDWVHEFTVTNNLAHKQIYFFGVQLNQRDVTGSPSGFDPETWHSWTNAGIGSGSGVVYNNNWTNFSNVTGVQPGGSLGGFKVRDTGAVALTDIRFFAFGFTPGSPDYNGADCFTCGFNPGFEGVATTVSGGGGGAVPEPATWGLMILGFGGAGSMIRRQRRPGGLPTTA